MARVTLSTIANETGLSKFAVSRSLSGKDGVSEETRKRVQEVADRLGYVRSPAESEVPVLGVVFHDTDLINSELHLLVQSGFQLEAQRCGYQVKMCWTHLTHEIEAFARNCSGIALVGPHPHQSMDAMKALGVPVVRSGWMEPLDPYDIVSGTDHEAGSAVANFLLDLGHRRIVYVHGTPGYRGRIERFYGVREILERHEDVQFREMRFQAETRFTEHLREVHDSGFHPTAFFCAHDGMALTVVSELLRLGYKIPDDVSVIGFGDFSAATQISPQLTTVKVHGRQIGSGLVRLLDDRICGRLSPEFAVRMMIAAQLIVRDSTGPASGATPDRSGGAGPGSAYAGTSSQSTISVPAAASARIASSPGTSSV